MANDPKDSQGRPAEPVDEQTSAPPAKRSGRVTFDARGNSVWEWQLETGVYSRDVSTQKLKKLDLGDLSIAETAIQESPLAKKPASGGFNPYDHSPASNQKGFDPYNKSLRARGEPAPSKRRPLTLDQLRKLSEVIKQQRALEQNKKKP